MLDSVFRSVLDRAAAGDGAAQGRLVDLARQGVLDGHVARVAAADDAEWDQLAGDVVEASGGDLTLGSLVERMLDMAGMPTSRHRVDLAGQTGAGTVDLANVDMFTTAPAGASRLANRDLAYRLEEQARVEDPGWADRTGAEITAASDLAWSRIRRAEPEDVSAPDPDSVLPPWEFAAKYGLGT